MLTPLTWRDGLRILDQTLLPGDEVWLAIDNYRELADAIRSLRVRGAPAIGVAAAYGLALTALGSEAVDKGELLGELRIVAEELRSTRPTAVNLGWALDRVLAAAENERDASAMRQAVLSEAHQIARDDIDGNMQLGQLGAQLLPERVAILTHCNAGALATGGYGTALGVVRAAVEQGKHVHVYATETRPLLQGARLTAWELARDGIECTLIVDSAAGSMMRRGLIQAVVVGADRIAANGDVANKVGTYPLAVLAREHSIPFYVAAPTSTIDLHVATGDDIPIETRSAHEVTNVAGRRVAAQGIEAFNPAFDVTPASYLSAIVTERSVLRPPYGEALSMVTTRVGALA